MIISDTQLLVYAALEGPNSELALRVLERDGVWAAPFLWRSEFRNALLGEIRVRGLPLDDALQAFHDAEAILSGREHHSSTHAVLAASEGNRITAYDLEFVVLARSLGVSLVTFDKQVLAAFPAVAVHPDAFLAS